MKNTSTLPESKILDSDTVTDNQSTAVIGATSQITSDKMREVKKKEIIKQLIDDCNTVVSEYRNQTDKGSAFRHAVFSVSTSLRALREHVKNDEFISLINQISVEGERAMQTGNTDDLMAIVAKVKQISENHKNDYESFKNMRVLLSEHTV